MIFWCSASVMARFSLKWMAGHCRRGMTVAGQPVHVEREVVRFAQVAVGGNGALLQHCEEVLGLRFD